MREGALIWRPLAVVTGPVGSAGVLVPRVDRRTPVESDMKSSSSEYVYFIRLPLVRPSYVLNPCSGRLNRSFCIWRYSRLLRFSSEASNRGMAATIF
jgi:hypothetical protein